MNEQTIKQLKANAKAIFAEVLTQWTSRPTAETPGEVQAMECSDGIVCWRIYNDEVFRLTVLESTKKFTAPEELEIRLEKIIDGKYQVVLNFLAPLSKAREWWFAEQQ